MRTGRLTISVIIIVSLLCTIFPAMAAANDVMAKATIKQALEAVGASDISFPEGTSSLCIDEDSKIAVFYTKVAYSVNGEPKISDSTIVLDSSQAQTRLVFASIDAKYYGDVKEYDGTLLLAAENSNIVAKRGDKNDTVKDIQRMLIQLGFLSGMADGEYGAGTEAAVKEFQSANGFTEDGVVSVSVYYKLQKETASTPESEAENPNSTTSMDNTELGLIKGDGKWYAVSVNLKSGETARTGDSYVLKSGPVIYCNDGRVLYYLTDKNGQKISLYEDDETGVYFPGDDETKAYIAKGETVIYNEKHPEYMDARGYIAKGVILYFEDDEDTLTPLLEVKDIAYNTIKDGIASGYILKVKDLETKKTYWQDGDFLLNTYAKNAGHPLWYLKTDDKYRKGSEEAIDYEYKGSWKSLRSGLERGVAVYMGEGQNKVYQFDVQSYDMDKNELYVKYPGGSVELKNYDSIVYGESFFVLDQ